MDKRINQWLAFLDDEDKELIKMAEEKNQTLKEARQIMNYLTGDEEIKRLTELRERWAFDRAMDINWANKTCVKKGIRQNQIRVAKKMLEKGKEIAEIIEMTELSEKEIKNLQKELNKDT